MIGLIVLAEIATTPTPLPNFTFRDMVAGEVAETKQMGSCITSKDRPEQQLCMAIPGKSSIDPDVAGVKTYRLSATFYKGRLETVLGKFRSADFETLVAAFTAKYGSPCDEKASTLQNAMGAKVQNQTVVWCFKSGKLLLDRYFDRIDQGSFFYIDEWHAPKEPPKVNF